MPTAAFFDVDNTLVKGSSLFLIGRGMLAHGVVRRRDVLRFAAVQVSFRLRGEHLGQMKGAQERALSLGTGLAVDHLVTLGRELYRERVEPRLWPQMVRVAQEHLAAGEEVWLVSAAPVELTQILADALGLTGALGTVCEVADGCWTGRLTGSLLHGPAKALAVRALAQDRDIDLGQCHAYSDSINDQHLLEAVGHPHAVNPDRALTRLAQSRGWPVRREGTDLRRTLARRLAAVRHLRPRAAD
jgi:HAD superfamily hydrolase (TIGR01490 family)